jgi:hypothetical protein
MKGDYVPLNGRELASAGRALFGVRWREELASVLGCSERFIADIEKGQAIAPSAWRAQVIGLAQDVAVRAMETASNLLMGEADAKIATPPPATAEAHYV